LIIGALAISPATLGRTNRQRESHGAQEGVTDGTIELAARQGKIDC
jgi:hypothetical protein